MLSKVLDNSDVQKEFLVSEYWLGNTALKSLSHLSFGSMPIQSRNTFQSEHYDEQIICLSVCLCVCLSE